MKRAAIYARFSTDMQRDRSIDDQFALCERYAEREGYEIATRYSDKAKSGASMFDRDGLLALREAAKRREFDAIIVESLDRLSRDTEDLAGLFKRTEHWGISLLTCNEGKATPIHVGLRGIMGQMFLKDTADKVKRAQVAIVKEGRFASGTVTFGYEKVLDEPGKRRINEGEAAVVRRIFTEYAAGKSPRVIAEGLSRDRIASPSGQPVWNHQCIITGSYGRGIISNRLYIGEMLWNTHSVFEDPDNGREIRRKNPDADHLITAVPDLRIVRQELWDAVQAVRNGRSVKKFGPTGRKPQRAIARNTSHLLSGVLYCAACNGSMRITQRMGNGVTRVGCSNAHKNGSCGHRKTYNIDALREIVLKNFRAELIDPERIKKATEAYHDEAAKLARAGNADRDEAVRELNKVKVQIDRITDSIANVGHSPALLAKLQTKEAELVQLEERVKLLTAKPIVMLHPAAINRYLEAVTKMHIALTGEEASEVSAEETHAAFRNLIDRIMVHPTPARAPYEVSAFSRSSAIMGIDLFPPKRSPDEIVAEAGGLKCVNGNSLSDVLPITHQQDSGLILLGHWTGTQQAA